MTPETRSKQELSLALYEQAEDAAFQAQPRHPCVEGHIWEVHLGELECANCGELVTFDWIG